MRIYQKLKASPGFVRYFANTSWVVLGNILRLIVGLLVGVYVARYLGPEQFGLLSYSVAFVSLFGVFATLGLDSIVIRELVKTPENRDELLGTAALMKLAGSILMVVLLLAGMQFSTEDDYTVMLVGIIASSYLFQAVYVADYHFQATVQSKYIVIAQSIQTFIGSIIKVCFVLTDAPLYLFAVAALIDSMLFAVGLGWSYYTKVGSILAWRFRAVKAVSLLKNAWPLILSSFAIMIYMRIDQVMIKHMLDNEAVGIYVAAVKISEAWYFLPMAITASLFPAIINAKKESKELYMDRLQKLHNLLAFIAIVIALPVSLLSIEIIGVLYGDVYVSAAPVLSIHMWGGVFVALGAASSKFLVSENMQLRAFFRTFAGMVINILMNLILIPHFGITGAAIATLVSYAFAGYLYDIFDPKCRAMFVIKTKAIFGFWRLT